MTLEARARQTIDALLMQAGWHVCNMADANFAIRDFQLNLDFCCADYPNHIDGKAAKTIAIKRRQYAVHHHLQRILLKPMS
jgi:type I restriction enzyme, R subunit